MNTTTFRATVSTTTSRYFVRMFDNGRKFVNIDPQLILNYETGNVSSAVETTFGFVVSQEKASPTTRRRVFPSAEIGPTTSRSRRALKRFGEGARRTPCDRGPRKEYY